MRSFLLLSFATLCVASVARAAGGDEDIYSKDSPVRSLTKKDFADFVKENDFVLVKFYAPWCGHCKKMAKPYEEAAKKLEEDSGKVKLAKVDVTQEADLGTEYQIQGFPTLKFFRHGTAEDYDGGRSADAILAWIKKMTGPSVVEIGDKAAVEKQIKEEALDIAFVGAFKSKDSAAYKAFEGAANKSRAVGKFFAYIASDASDEVTVYRDNEGAVASKKAESEEAIIEFSKAEKFPYFGPINGENYALYSGSGLNLGWFTGAKKDFEAHGEMMREVGKNTRGACHLVWLDTDQFGSHAENHLGVKDFPALVYQIKEARYIFPTPIKSASAKEVTQFLKDADAGKIERSIKSDPIPETNDEPVKIVVSKNFEKMVFNENKDVLLEVYAPWCGHCKKLEPVYTKVAELLAPHDHIVLAKMDGTANESPVEGFDWNGFPTIFFVKAGSKTPVPFDGERTEEGIYKYLQKHSSKKIPDYKKEGSAEEENKDEL